MQDEAVQGLVGINMERRLLVHCAVPGRCPLLADRVIRYSITEGRMRERMRERERMRREPRD